MELEDFDGGKSMIKSIGIEDHGRFGMGNGWRSPCN